MLRKILITVAASNVATSTECYDNTKETACMSATENGESCSWCTSAAVGNSCMKESDAKGLPSSVFKCEYQTYLDEAAVECYDNTKETACMSATENGESCSWCTSAAVGNSCMKESDAKGLPSSVFKCEYQSLFQKIMSSVWSLFNY
jgi:hypothetical protein